MKLRKYLAIVLIFAMILSIFPLNALAEDLGSDNTTNEASDTVITNEIKDDMAEENNADKPVEATNLINDARIQVQESMANTEDWDTSLSSDEKTITLTSYKGTSKDVVIPASGDFGGTVENVQIPYEVMKSIATVTKATSIDISKNGDPVIAKAAGPWHYLFSDSSAYNTTLISLDLSRFDTSNISDMSYMFYNCSALTNLKLFDKDQTNCPFKTSQVGHVEQMFRGCSSLESLDLSKFDTNSATDMNNMFSGCNALKSLDLSNFNTSNVTNMYNMFSDCKSLKSLNLSSFNTSKVTTMGCMFFGCTSLTDLDLSKFDTSSVTNFSTMFYNCNALTSLDLSKFSTGKATDMSVMFYHCEALTSLNLSKFDTSNVKNMMSMFLGCNALRDINLSKFDTSKVTNIGSMFAECASLTSLDLSNFNTSSVTNISSMFYECTSLKSLNLNNFDTSNVTNMYGLFYGCSKLKIITVSDKWSTGKVTSSAYMFHDCSLLVGGKGTTYSSKHKDAEYARIDGGPSSNTPGYFTSSAAVLVKGDVDQDGDCDIEDAKLAKRIAMKDKTAVYTGDGFKAGDLDGNGTITINEVRKIERVALGKTSFE